VHRFHSLSLGRAEVSQGRTNNPENTPAITSSPRETAGRASSNSDLLGAPKPPVSGRRSAASGLPRHRAAPAAKTWLRLLWGTTGAHWADRDRGPGHGPDTSEARPVRRKPRPRRIPGTACRGPEPVWRSRTRPIASSGSWTGTSPASIRARATRSLASASINQAVAERIHGRIWIARLVDGHRQRAGRVHLSEQTLRERPRRQIAEAVGRNIDVDSKVPDVAWISRPSR
jgi:hypothetical protein